MVAWLAASIACAGGGAAVALLWPAPAAERAETIAYGPDPRQRIDVWPAAGQGARPAILYVHGGGWDAGGRESGGGAKPRHFGAAGIVWASVGYRLVPETTVEGQLADIARALRLVRDRAPALGIDPDRIMLAGHSSGAHLAAVMGTDPRWLDAAGVPRQAVAGVILIDSAALDVPAVMRSALPGTNPHHDRAFGEDPARQAALSPLRHTSGWNAPRWLLVHDAASIASVRQNARFGELLGGSGAAVTIQPVGNSDHGRMERDLGRRADPVAAAIDGWLMSPRSASP